MLAITFAGDLHHHHEQSNVDISSCWGTKWKRFDTYPFSYLYWLFTVTKKRCFPQVRVRRIGCLLWHRHDCFLSLVYEDVAELLFQFKLKIWSSPFHYSPNEKWRLNCSKVALHAPIFLRGKYVRFYDCMRFRHENATVLLIVRLG